jgi:protease I
MARILLVYSNMNMKNMAKVAVLLGPEFEDTEFTHPVAKLREAGHQVEVLGTKANETLEGKRHETKVETNAAVGDRQSKDYDALLIPGGHSPDNLRTDEQMVRFVRDFDRLQRPIAAICHGPQLLIEAGVVEGRTMTSWPSVRTDLRNAGANVVDSALCRDGNLITSRKPDDLDEFTAALLQAVSAQKKSDAVSDASPS